MLKRLKTSYPKLSIKKSVQYIYLHLLGNVIVNIWHQKTNPNLPWWGKIIRSNRFSLPMDRHLYYDRIARHSFVSDVIAVHKLRLIRGNSKHLTDAKPRPIEHQELSLS